MDKTYRVVGVVVGCVFIAVGLSAIDIQQLSGVNYRGQYTAAVGERAVWLGVAWVAAGLVCIVHCAQGTRWRVPAIVAACSAAALVLLIALRQPAAG